MVDLTGRKVIITGASQGLGAEIARQYVNSGASVVLCSRTQHDLNAVKEDLEQDYSTNDFIVVEGSAGYGFIEDTSCYHRALKPINKSRLCLQFRYH